MSTQIISFTHADGVSIATLPDGKKLISATKPELSFLYDELSYTEEIKEYKKDDIVQELTGDQQASVISHMLNICEEENVQLAIEADPEASRKINASDWRLQQYWEQKELVRLGVLSDIYITEAEYTDILIERQRLRDIAGSASE
jgi:hypothetical protein